jgi:hypothetical protein
LKLLLEVLWLAGLELPDRKKLGNGDVAKTLFGVLTWMIRGAHNFWKVVREKP